MFPRLILGSANFGLNYGIANKRRLNKKEVFALLKTASRLKIWGIDTARGYGKAEEIIGSFFKQHGRAFKVITKLAYKKYVSPQVVKKEVTDSLRKLNIEYIDFVLLHSPKIYQYYKDNVIRAFQGLKSDGIIRNWGISVYHPEEVDRVLNDGLSNFAVEFPVNLFDRRFLRKNFLGKLKGKKCFLFARSVFLQGLFLMRDYRLTSNFTKIKDKIKHLYKIGEKYNLSISSIALLFVQTQPHIDGVIIGVDSKAQLEDNASAGEKLKTYQRMKALLDGLEVKDEKIILPYNWRPCTQ